MLKSVVTAPRFIEDGMFSSLFSFCSFASSPSDDCSHFARLLYKINALLLTIRPSVFVFNFMFEPPMADVRDSGIALLSSPSCLLKVACTKIDNLRASAVIKMPPLRSSVYLDD